MSFTRSAYLVVVLIWSTTPLAIQWSSVGLHPLIGVSLRMLAAVAVGYILLKVAGLSIEWSRMAWKNYAAGAIGIVGGLVCVYLGARYVPSGLISVIFGLSPVLTGILAVYVLGEPPLTLMKWLALLLSIMGLVIIFSNDVGFDRGFFYGAGLILLGAGFFSLSAVLVKFYELNGHPLSQTMGTLVFALPFYLLLSLPVIADVKVAQVPFVTFGAILYLGIGGSLLGFLSYFYILRKLSPSTVALVTLITPVLALFLGIQLNHEHISAATWLGVCAIISGLACFLWGDKLMQKINLA